MKRDFERLVKCVAALVLAASLAACGSGSSPTAGPSSAVSPNPPTVLPTPAPIATTSRVVVGPGEEWIAAYRDGMIHLVRPDGSGDIIPFPSVPAGEQQHPDWSPSGDRVVFTIIGATSVIWTGNVDGSHAQLAVDCQAPCQAADEAAWSPDGSSLVYQRIASKDGKDVSTLEILNLTTNETRVILTAPAGRAFYQPRWSPDGSRLVTEYVKTANGTFNLALAIVDLTAAEPLADEITDGARLTNSPDWSWATNLIVFVQPTTPAGFQGPSDVVTIRPDGTDAKALIRVGARGDQTPQPAWSPDGSRIIFVQSDGSMATVAVDGTVSSRRSPTDHPDKDSTRTCGPSPKCPRVRHVHRRRAAVGRRDPPLRAHPLRCRPARPRWPAGPDAVVSRGERMAQRSVHDVRAVAWALVIVLCVAACGGGPAWPKTAGETICREWTSEMTGAQRSALGAAMLLALRANDGGTIQPSEGLLTAYANAIADVCATTPEAKISAVGATIYGLSRDLRP